MSVALIELVEMTATLNVVVSINSTTVMQTYWTAPSISLQHKDLGKWIPASSTGMTPFSVASTETTACLAAAFA